MVDIIMPAYNGHATICQAVASVAMQDRSEDIQPSEEAVALLRYKQITDHFYEDNAVRAMIRRNVMITVTLDDFLGMIFDEEEEHHETEA